MNKTSVIALFALLALGACNMDQKEQFDNMKVLEGEWQGAADGGTFYESWTRVNDSTLEGSGFFVHTGDTIFRETLRIAREDNTKVYTANVPTQNQGRDIQYRLTDEKEGEMTFENPEHDYPQRIIYEITEDSVFARLEGKRNGENSTEAIRMGRRK